MAPASSGIEAAVMAPTTKVAEVSEAAKAKQETSKTNFMMNVKSTNGDGEKNRGAFYTFSTAFT